MHSNDASPCRRSKYTMDGGSLLIVTWSLASFARSCLAAALTAAFDFVKDTSVEDTVICFLLYGASAINWLRINGMFENKEKS